MTVKTLYFLLSLFCLAVSPALAQKFPEHPPAEEPRNKGKAILLHLSGGVQKPGGDLADRFGNNGALGGGVEFLTANNWIIGTETQFYFGRDVKDDPLTFLRTPDGDIIGNDRNIATVALRQRGLYLGGAVGRLFTFKKDARSGLRLNLGAGWTYHKIRIQDDTRSVTQLTGDYLKGYDRLSSGLAFNEFIGWQNLAPNRRSNWMIGFEFNQGLTENRRSWDFAEMKKLDGRRLDLRFGLRATWTLPFYIGSASKIYY